MGVLAWRAKMVMYDLDRQNIHYIPHPPLAQCFYVEYLIYAYMIYFWLHIHYISHLALCFYVHDILNLLKM